MHKSGAAARTAQDDLPRRNLAEGLQLDSYLISSFLDQT